jgi:hypothetical protein
LKDLMDCKAISLDSLLSILPVDQLNALEGFMDQEEAEQLAFRAAQVHTEAGHVIVELGSFKGKSACWMAAGSQAVTKQAVGIQAGNGARVYCIDPWERYDPGDSYPDKTNYAHKDIYEIFQAQVGKMGMEDFMTPIKGYSHEVVKNWKLPIGLLHIDAFHTHENCLADYLAWSPFVVPGGWIAFHDYANGFFGVKRVVEEVVRPSGLWEDFNFYKWKEVPVRRGLMVARRKM